MSKSVVNHVMAFVVSVCMVFGLCCGIAPTVANAASSEIRTNAWTSSKGSLTMQWRAPSKMKDYKLFVEYHNNKTNKWTKQSGFPKTYKRNSGQMTISQKDIKDTIYRYQMVATTKKGKEIKSDCKSVTTITAPEISALNVKKSGKKLKVSWTTTLPSTSHDGSFKCRVTISGKHKYTTYTDCKNKKGHRTTYTISTKGYKTGKYKISVQPYEETITNSNGKVSGDTRSKTVKI